MSRMDRHSVVLSLFLAASSMALLEMPAIAQSHSAGDDVVRPPREFSSRQMRNLVETARRNIAPMLSVEFLDTPAWSEYVNHHHFVPLTCDGAPPGYVVDFNWDGPKAGPHDHRSLPSGEITESGEFSIWLDVCNYREYSRQQCVDFISWLISHENGHHAQWMALAAEAIQIANGSSKVERPFPGRIGELPGAAIEVFMKKWGDCAHYQCREVEVYTQQIVTGDMGTAMAQQRLKTLCEYYTSCKASEWKADFKAALDRADVVYGWLGTPCQAGGNTFE